MTRARARLVPEVLQSSLMDCGPAALQAVLQGYGMSVDYDTIRARCQTDVDGTSIFELAKLAGELGVRSSQVLVPRDHLLLTAADCLPAIVVTREAAGVLHFVVVWNTLGPFVQVMDPNTGRSFQRRAEFLASLPDVPISISVERFARWRKTRFAREPLQERLRTLGVAPAERERWVLEACCAVDHRPYAKLDAATRMLTTLVEGGAVARRGEAQRLLESVLERSAEDGIPIGFWWVWDGATPDTLSVRGAPIVHFEAPADRQEPVVNDPRRRPAADRVERPAVPPSRASSADAPAADGGGPIGAPLRAHLERHGLATWALLWRMLTLQDPRAPLHLSIAVLLSAAVACADVMVLQAVLHATRQLALPQQRLAGVLVLLSLSCVGLALEVSLARIAGRIGRGLELRVRAALFEKLPRLGDDYLRTRSTSDMAQRGHALHLLRGVPVLARRGLEAVSSLATSCAGIALLYPPGALATLSAACATVIVPLTMMRAAGERSLRARTHMVALDRFYLDALVGVVPIRVHGAQRAVRREHESLLVEWARAALGMHAQTTWMQTVEALLSACLLWSLVSAYLASDLPRSGLLLLVYWAARMPAAGGALVDGLVAYRALQHAAVRLLSPLGAAEPGRAAAPLPAPATTRGVSLALRGVSVKVANRALLRDVELQVRAGEHVAVVGPSGAGKSSLVGLLLGWRSPSGGELQIDGVSASGAEIASLRRQTAWVDPAVQLWNDSLLNNVLYGSAGSMDGALARLAQAMEHAQLGDVIENLPGGLQAPLGEAGACVSGGQGQRVRLARALLRHDARLVILDEPFRGLSRELRQALLCRVREHFRDATLLFVSHDIRDTREFARVLVVDGGRICEDAAPQVLLARPDSRYRALLQADEHQPAFRHAAWRHAHMDAGRLAEPQ